jgi:energy-coupling factor transporter transmembrane protein EcfT
MSLHPSIRIILLLVLAAVMPMLKPVALSVLMGLMAAILCLFGVKPYLSMLRRMRWLFLSMLIIYAFSTPGEYWAGWPYWVAPTYEGVHAGLLQALRLALMLAGLALLLATTSRDALIVGFFIMLQPFRYLGMDAERFAARLWLTLHYVEQPQSGRSPAAMFERLKTFQLDEVDEPSMTIHLETPTLGWQDCLVLSLMLAIGIAVS